MFKTKVEQSFEHWHHFYAVDLVFTITLRIFYVHFHSRFLESCACKEVKNKLHHHHVISMVCAVINHSSQPISTQEITHML